MCVNRTRGRGKRLEDGTAPGAAASSADLRVWRGPVARRARRAPQLGRAAAAGRARGARRSVPHRRRSRCRGRWRTCRGPQSDTAGAWADRTTCVSIILFRMAFSSSPVAHACRCGHTHGCSQRHRRSQHGAQGKSTSCDGPGCRGLRRGRSSSASGRARRRPRRPRALPSPAQQHRVMTVRAASLFKREPGFRGR